MPDLVLAACSSRTIPSASCDPTRILSIRCIDIFGIDDEDRVNGTSVNRTGQAVITPCRVH